MIAAIYVALTFLSALMGLSSGAIQLRLSEAMCLLPLIFPEAIVGLTLGCAIANLVTGCVFWDIVFGSVATLIGALGAYLLRRLPEKLDFADFSGYSYGKITVQDGVIRAEEMIASLPDHVLLDDGSEYVLRLGLRKYLDDGTPSEVIVVLHGDTESYVTHEGENAMAFTQGANYTIPANLSEGRYLLVAFVATADEGIRVSRTVPLASVDFESGSVESEVAEITYEKVEDNMLVVTSRSKLYTEVVLAGDLPLTAASVLEQLTVKAMGLGIPAEDAVLELYDSESGQGTALAEGSPLVAGTYRLKYRTTSGGGADAFVYCVVTEEMLIPSA